MAKPETLKKALLRHNIRAEVIHEINSTFDDVTDKSPKRRKAEYLSHAMKVMDAELDEDTRRKVMESCACTIGSSVEKKTEQFSKKSQSLSLDEKVKRLREIKHLGNPVLQEDGSILITSGLAKSGAFHCSCPQISGAENISLTTPTYCMCCAGHYRYQYEKALGVAIDVTLLASPLESAGEMPCTFVLTIRDNSADQ